MLRPLLAFLLCLSTSTICYAQDDAAAALELLRDSGLLTLLVQHLPPWAIAWLVVALSAGASISALLWAAKQALNRWYAPAELWPKWLRYTFAVLDVIAANSAPVLSMLRHRQTEKSLDIAKRDLEATAMAVPDGERVSMVSDVLGLEGEDDSEVQARTGIGRGTPFALALFISIGALTNEGCSLSAEQRARTTLNTMTLVIDPASKAAHDYCAAAVGAVKDRVDADGFKTREEAQAALDKVADPCKVTDKAFAEIRALHGEAVKAIESGDLKAAQGYIAQLQAAWKRVRS